MIWNLTYILHKFHLCFESSKGPACLNTRQSDVWKQLYKIKIQSFFWFKFNFKTSSDVPVKQKGLYKSGTGSFNIMTTFSKSAAEDKSFKFPLKEDTIEPHSVPQWLYNYGFRRCKGFCFVFLFWPRIKTPLLWQSFSRVDSFKIENICIQA